MRPALRSGLLPIWRDRDTVQIGIDPRRAVALAGMRTASDVIRLLDGSRDREQVLAAATEHGVPASVTERVLTVLAAAGVLIDFPAGALRSIPVELRPQLMPALAAASLALQDGDGGARLLARRSATTVHVYGSGPVACAVADLLTGSGVAALAVPPTGQPPTGQPPTASQKRATRRQFTRPQTTARRQATGQPPTGQPPTGQPPVAGRQEAAAHREPAGRRASVPPPDFAVLVGHQSAGHAIEFQRHGTPHLAVLAEEAIGVVGPLVLPGRSACLRCLDLARADADPAWPLILAQVATRAADPPACDPVLAAAVAAQAAAQAIAFADRAPLAAATANGTLELVMPAWQWRRRTWLPHPACTCGSFAAVSQSSAARG